VVVVVVVVLVVVYVVLPKQSGLPTPIISILALGATTVPSCASNIIERILVLSSCVGAVKPSHSTQYTDVVVFSGTDTL
jgi:hypothetical protein